MKALLLVRVSTQHQDYSSQITELKEYANKLGYNNLHIIADKESAIKLSEEERHGLNEMKAYLTSNPDCKNVFIWELSRLARNEKILHSIKEWLVSRKINLHIVTEHISLLDENGKESYTGGLLFSLFGHLATQEMKDKKARLNRGKKAVAEKGKWTGGRYMRFGFTVNEDNYIIINEAEAKVVRMIFEMYASGQYSTYTLYKELKERGYKFTYDRIKSMLSDTAYHGGNDSKLLFKKYPVLVDDELWEKVQAMKKRNTNEKTKESVHHYFGTRIVKCIKCGNYYSVSNGFYLCTNSKYYKRLEREKCDNINVHSLYMDNCLLHTAKANHIKYMAFLNEASKKEIGDDIIILNQKIDTAHSELNKLSQQKSRCKKLYIIGDLGDKEYQEMMTEIVTNEQIANDNIKRYNEQIKLKEKALNDLNNKNNKVHDLDVIFKIINNEDNEELRQLIHKYIVAAYPSEINVSGKPIRLINILGINNQISTYIYDSYARRGDRCKLIEIKGKLVAKLLNPNELTTNLQFVMNHLEEFHEKNDELKEKIKQIHGIN